MEEANKLSIKRVELSLTKFNEVAIPHHLDLLRQHKANIIKYEQSGQHVRVRAEQTHAGRVAGQLRALLADCDALRRQLRAPDLAAFDALTQRSRDLTLAAILDYLGVIERSCRALAVAAHTQMTETSPMSINRSTGAGPGVAGSAVSSDSVGVVAHGEEEPQADTPLPLLQLQLHDQVQSQEEESDAERSLRERESVLRGWSELQGEVRALHDTWRQVHAAALAQREQVAASATHVESAGEHVQAARAHLSAAERLRAGVWGAGGAALGALAGGPVGLAVGAKAGAAAALGGSLLGYLGARLLGSRRRGQLDAERHKAA